MGAALNRNTPPLLTKLYESSESCTTLATDTISLWTLEDALASEKSVALPLPVNTCGATFEPDALAAAAWACVA